MDEQEPMPVQPESQEADLEKYARPSSPVYRTWLQQQKRQKRRERNLEELPE